MARTRLPFPTLEVMQAIRDAVAEVYEAISKCASECGTPDRPRDSSEGWANCAPMLAERVARLRKCLQVGGQPLTSDRVRGWDDLIKIVFAGVPEPRNAPKPIPGLASWLAGVEHRLTAGIWPVVGYQGSSYIGTALRMLDRSIAKHQNQDREHHIREAMRSAKPPAALRPGLSENQQVALDILRSTNTRLTGAELMKEMRRRGIQIEQNVLTSRVMTVLKDYYGVKNDGDKKGYYVMTST